MKNSNKIILITSLILLLILSGCGITGNIVNKEKTKIGVIIPLTGESSFYGQYIKSGIDLALEDYNNIEVIYEDSMMYTSQGVTAYQKLKMQGVKIFMPFSSNIILAISPLAELDNNIVLSIGGAAPSITSAGDNIFRHNLLPQDEAKRLSKEIKKDYNEIAIIYVNTESGQSYYNEIVKEYKKINGNIILTENYEKGNNDFKTILTKLKDKNIKVVFFVGYMNEFGNILKQSYEMDINVQWYSPYVTEGPKLLEIAEKSAEGIIYTHFFDIELDKQEFKDYRLKYLKKYNKDPEAYSILAYDDILIISNVLKKCETNDIICIKNVLYNEKFEGATGKIVFDENGDSHKDLILKTVKNGKFVTVT